jgi:hypothetical protein
MGPVRRDSGFDPKRSQACVKSRSAAKLLTDPHQSVMLSTLAKAAACNPVS